MQVRLLPAPPTRMSRPGDDGGLLICESVVRVHDLGSRSVSLAVKAPACHAGGHRFESVTDRHTTPPLRFTSVRGYQTWGMLKGKRVAFARRLSARSVTAILHQQCGRRLKLRTRVFKARSAGFKPRRLYHVSQALRVKSGM